MAKTKKPQANSDPFANFLNPFQGKVNPKAKPRKRKSASQNTDLLATFIKETRLKQGWTQRDLAERATVGLRQVSDLERGKLNVAFKTLSRVLAVLGYELFPRPLREADATDE